MLVRSDALKAAGGIDAIRNALIDDCSLAKLLKAQGPIWLGLTERVLSTRPYPGVEDIRRMVSRSAYAQLRYSPLLLAGTVVGMALTYLAPPLLTLFASGPARWLGLLAWGLMAVAFPPTLRLYGRSLLWGWRCPPSRCATCCSPSIPPCSTPAARADCGRGACRPWNNDPRSRRTALRQGPPGRELSGRVAADPSAPSRRHPRLLRIRAGRRRYRRSCDAGRAREARSPRSTWKRACSARTTSNRKRSRCGRVLRERNLSPRHAQDLLTAFRMDVTKLRYRDWDDLMDYCSYSAMPVGRYVLDVHGEDRSTWPANDALCAALQIINHLQDCKKDYQSLNRVYVPEDALAAAGATVEDIGRDAATPALRRCLVTLAERTGRLLDESAAFSPQIKDFRLAMEVAVIQSLARRLVGLLMRRDPLSERVHLGKGAVAGVGLLGIVAGTAGRFSRAFAASQQPAVHERAPWTRPARHQPPRIAPPAARSTRRCASCRRAARCDVRDLRLLPRGRRHRRLRRAAAGADRPARRMARRDQRSL